MTIKKRLQTLKTELTDFSGNIVAVTKYSTPEQMIEAYEAGLKNFGESKIQLIEEKWGVLPEDLINNINWHFIGHIQTNKVKKIIGKFQLIHSVDSVKLAIKIDKEAGDLNLIQNILLQVNIS
ncbi:MAG: YggS family pyridoxal phosphate-dependent enzyme, partial [Vampirovibrionia bacterium]